MDLDSPEEIFGQIIEMNDEVFDEMFEKKEVEPGNNFQIQLKNQHSQLSSQVTGQD